MQSVRIWSITRVVFAILLAACWVNSADAQEATQSGKIDRAATASNANEKTSTEKVAVEKTAQAKPAAAKTGSAVNEKAKDDTKTPSDAATKNVAPKRVDSAVINLQTTVTGNQEQPRVMYILPWQSPAPEDVDFESLENQTKSVFSHIERDELRRELESTQKKQTKN